MTYVLICPFSYEMIADGKLFVFLFGLHVLTEQNTKVTTLCLFPTFFSGCWCGFFHIHQIQKSGNHQVRWKLNNLSFSKVWTMGVGR